MFSNYDFEEGSRYNSLGHQIRSDVNQLREEVVEATNEQTKTQSEEAEKTRTNQTSLFGKLIDTIKSVFTGNNEKGEEESFYKMIARENNETQEYLATHNQTASEKLSGIINSLNTISNDIESGTEGDKSNAELIRDAIKNLKLVVN